jgi:hypothetical protein
VWIVDNRLVYNLEGICGILGIDQPASKIIAGLGRAIQPGIPAPRLLGRSTSPFNNLEVAKICIYPDERSYRIDVCLGKKKSGRRITLSPEITNRFMKDIPYNDVASRLRNIWITKDEGISSECPEYDFVVWRGNYLFLSTSPICILLDIFGMTEEFARWASLLVKHGEIPIEELPLFKQHLATAKVLKCDELLGRLVLPFHRRFGYFHQKGQRISHKFLDEW